MWFLQDAKAGDHRSREWLSRYLLGNQRVEAGDGLKFHFYLREVQELDEHGQVVSRAAAKHSASDDSQ